jgi:serine/threonine protein kinase
VNRQIRPESAIYQIEEAIGQGLSATVYRAVRMDARGFSRQTVALKILKSENAVPWLKREFETLTRVRSSNCVRVLGWENLSDGCALVLEWIDGVRLLDLGRTNLLTEQARTSALSQIQAGLSALHAEGLHHGDLSPANVLIDCDGVVKLIDFATPDQAHDVLHGTLEYLAPEIWRGGQASRAADLFALGVIAHDLETRFFDHPLSRDEALRRALRLSENETGWLAHDPLRRSPIEVASSQIGRDELARAVKEYRASRARIETAVLNASEVPSAMESVSNLRADSNTGRRSPEPESSFVSVDALRSRKKSVVRLAVAIGAIICVISAAGQAQAPRSKENELRGQLEIRSLAWFEVAVNGKPVGFTPVSLKRLRPGSHRISWKSATMAGETRITVLPGQTTLVTERDFGALKRR